MDFWGVLAQYGPGTLIIGVLVATLAFLVRYWVVAIMRGELVPRSTVDGMRQDYQSRLTDLGSERDQWRQAHGTSEATRSIQDEQMRELLAAANLTNHFLTGMRTGLEP